MLDYKSAERAVASTSTMEGCPIVRRARDVAIQLSGLSGEGDYGLAIGQHGVEFDGERVESRVLRRERDVKLRQERSEGSVLAVPSLVWMDGLPGQVGCVRSGRCADECDVVHDVAKRRTRMFWCYHVGMIRVAVERVSGVGRVGRVRHGERSRRMCAIELVLKSLDRSTRRNASAL